MKLIAKRTNRMVKCAAYTKVVIFMRKFDFLWTTWNFWLKNQHALYIIESCKSVVFGHASPSTPLKEEAKGAPYSGGAREGSPLVNRLNLQQFFGTKTKNVWCWRHNFLESFTVEYLLFYQNLTMKKTNVELPRKKSLGSIDLFVFFYLLFFLFFLQDPGIFLEMRVILLFGDWSPFWEVLL